MQRSLTEGRWRPFDGASRPLGRRMRPEGRFLPQWGVKEGESGPKSVSFAGLGSVGIVGREHGRIPVAVARHYREP